MCILIKFPSKTPGILCTFLTGEKNRNLIIVKPHNLIADSSFHWIIKSKIGANRVAFSLFYHW